MDLVNPFTTKPLYAFLAYVPLISNDDLLDLIPQRSYQNNDPFYFYEKLKLFHILLLLKIQSLRRLVQK